MATARITQVVVEALDAHDAPAAIVSQLVVEVLDAHDAPAAIVSQLVVEALNAHSAPAGIVSQLVVETLSRPYTQTSGLIGSAELSIPDISTDPTAGLVGYVEFDVPLVVTQGQLGFAELAVSGAARIDQLVTETLTTRDVVPGLIDQVVVESLTSQPDVQAWISQLVVETISRPLITTSGFIGSAELFLPTTMNAGRVGHAVCVVPKRVRQFPTVLTPLQTIAVMFIDGEWILVYGDDVVTP